MKETQSNEGNHGHQSGPQSHGDQQKGTSNDTQPRRQKNPTPSGKPHTTTGGVDPEIPSHGAEFPLTSQNRKSGSGQGDEDQDEREEAAEKEPFRERPLSHPETDQGNRDSGQVTGNHGSFNPARRNRPSGN